MNMRARDLLRNAAFVTCFLALGASAHAANCWQITGWLNASNQPSTGQIGDHAKLVSTACVAPAPTGYGWLHPTLAYAGAAPDDLYVSVSLSDSHVSGSTFSPLLIFAGMVGNKPFLVLDGLPCIPCNNTMAFVPQPGPCTRGATWWTGPISTWFDGANCYVNPVPAGATPFISSNRYYVQRVPSTICQVGTYDGANCYVMPVPNGGFIYNNGFYAPAGANHTCAVGTWDGANCFILSVPPGSKAFIYNGAFYASTRQCAVGRYDGANCYLGTAPSSPTATTPFVWNGAFYYGE